MIDRQHGWNVSMKPLILGLVLSLVFIFGLYRIVVHRHLSHIVLMYVVFGFSIVQALLQLVFFFHLGLEEKPHWSTIIFLLTALVILIVVGGSLWIMQNLDYNLMLYGS